MGHGLISVVRVYLEREIKPVDPRFLEKERNIFFSITEVMGSDLSGEIIVSMT